MPLPPPCGGTEATRAFMILFNSACWHARPDTSSGNRRIIGLRLILSISSNIDDASLRALDTVSPPLSSFQDDVPDVLTDICRLRSAWSHSAIVNGTSRIRASVCATQRLARTGSDDQHDVTREFDALYLVW